MLRKILQPFHSQPFMNFSSHKLTFPVQDVKNQHLFYVQDQEGKLPFMKEVLTEQGQKGIVLKLQGKSTTIIGFYHKVNPTSTLHIKQINSRQITPLPFNSAHNIEGKEITKVKDITPINKLVTDPQTQKKGIRLPTVSPILSSCYNMFYGDFIAFEGSLGSSRTKNALNIINMFVHQPQTMAIYLNPNISAKNDCIKAISNPNTLALARFSEQQQLTSVGIFMLAVKCIEMAKRYKQEGKNVLLVADNFNEIIYNEWSILKSLNLPISPFSLLNELYSSCEFSPRKKGSLTTIVCTSPEDDEINTLQQITSFTNNPKHLRTVAKNIPFPLKITSNYNQTENPYINSVRQCINRLIKQKQQTEMMRKLKLDKEQPWDYYYILDSDWWMVGLKKFQPATLQERDLFLWFLNNNIENELCAHWTIPCIQAYNRYLQYLAGDEMKGIDEGQFQNFMVLAKMQGYLSVYKRDYLH